MSTYVKALIVTALLFSANSVMAGAIHDPAWMIVNSFDRTPVSANDDFDFMAVINGEMENKDLYDKVRPQDGPLAIVACLKEPNEKGEWGVVLDRSIYAYEAEMVIKSKELCDEIKARLDEGKPFKIQVDRETNSAGQTLATADMPVLPAEDTRTEVSFGIEICDHSPERAFCRALYEEKFKTSGTSGE